MFYFNSLIYSSKKCISLTIGIKANTIIFDLTVSKVPTDHLNSHQLATGFEKVLVNGKLVRDNEQLAEKLSG
ncbi:hypothetical protein UMM65_12845 [Aureibaculum sp. 2210JD6-5]|uniref:hypothetical protein n=1 Tax=Aureibaculum sp. 2210JD6-5 TaxID=3103957 RepID=UPI002AAD3E35|nr:hypothetical protein [Aureibaculum sp. 2210JD6-5]MDY7396131.1 hypothetical protein [Aureibaculum sp. 2210JD6-5]